MIDVRKWGTGIIIIGRDRGGTQKSAKLVTAGGYDNDWLPVCDMKKGTQVTEPGQSRTIGVGLSIRLHDLTSRGHLVVTRVEALRSDLFLAVLKSGLSQ